MVELTFLARVTDGLILSETWEANSPMHDGRQNADINAARAQAKMFLKRIQHTPDKCSVDSGPWTYHFVKNGGVAFLTVCSNRYPKKLAFAFLDDIVKAFDEELKSTFGTCGVDYPSRIETIEKPYFFIKFDRVISKKKADYRDPDSSKAISKLNDSLNEVTHIMRKNIDEILQRGENLEDVGRKALDLKQQSEKFKGLSKVLSFRAMLQQYAPLAFVGLFILCILFWKFFM